MSVLTRVLGDSGARKLLRAAGASFLLRIGGYALAFGIAVVLARILGVRHYGAYAEVMAWLSVAFLLGKVGFDRVLWRLVPAYASQQQWGHLRGVITFCNRNAFRVSLAVAAMAAAAVKVASPWLPDYLRDTFWVACVVLPLQVLATLRSMVLAGLLRVVSADVPELLVRPIAQATLLGIVFAFFGFDSAVTGMTCYLAAVAISYALGAWLQARALPPQLKDVAPVFERRQWWSVGFSMLLVAGAQLIMTQTDTVMLGRLMDSEAVGVYTAASRVAMVLQLGITAVAAYMGPTAAGLWAKRDIAGLQRLMAITGVVVFALTAVGVAFLLLLGDWVLSIFGGPFASGGHDAMLILVASQAIYCIAAPASYLIGVTEHQRVQAWVVGAAALANVVLNALFIPYWGVEGAALATTLCTAGWTLTLVVVAYRVTGVRTSIWAALSRR